MSCSVQRVDKEKTTTKPEIAPPGQSFSGFRQELSVMTYNVENLFDTVHDTIEVTQADGSVLTTPKEDYAYLPHSVKEGPMKAELEAFCAKESNPLYKKECLYLDWSEDVLAEKMKRLAQVIRKVNDGKGPDLLFLQEVENERVLRKLINAELSDMGYKYISVSDDSDVRGIDVAVISRFPFAEDFKTHKVPDVVYPDGSSRPTRGILETAIQINSSKILRTFVVHMPNPNNPVEGRKNAILKLKEISTPRAGEISLIAGDWNTTQAEEFKNRFIKDHIMPNFFVSDSDLLKNLDWIGSNCYIVKGRVDNEVWSFLDRIAISKNAKFKELTLINSAPYQKSDIGRPVHFFNIDNQNKTLLEGVSDHWPISAKILVN